VRERAARRRLQAAVRRPFPSCARRQCLCLADGCLAGFAHPAPFTHANPFIHWGDGATNTAPDRPMRHRFHLPSSFSARGSTLGTYLGVDDVDAKLDAWGADVDLRSSDEHGHGELIPVAKRAAEKFGGISTVSHSLPTKWKPQSHSPPNAIWLSCGVRASAILAVRERAARRQL
jgi:hypothetical protein